MLNFRSAEFIKSAAKLEQLPLDHGGEIAFLGRSNAGKSSALNTLTGNKKLARVSKTPGRTQLLNFFSLSKQYRLVDLPGYGYAKVSASERRKWQALIDDYLRCRESLKAVVLIMDIRHPFKLFDRQLLAWAEQASMPAHVVLAKSDKLSRGAANITLQKVQSTLREEYAGASVQLFSSLNQSGLEDLKKQLFALLTAS